VVETARRIRQRIAKRLLKAALLCCRLESALALKDFFQR
jgi:hypothetical protein